jgi:hypothetical protein
VPTHRRRDGRLLIVLATAASALLAALCLAAPALAAPIWSQPTDLAAPGATPRIATDAEGDAVAVWEVAEGRTTAIWSSSHPAGGQWEAAVELGRDGPYPFTRSPVPPESKPQVVIGAGGGAVVLWQGYNGSRFTVESATRTTAGQWSGAVEVSGAWFGAEIQLAIDPAGTAAAVWLGANAAPESAELPAGGQWSAPVALSSQPGFTPRIAVDPVGDSTAVWSLGTGPIQVSSRPAGGQWSAPLDLSAAGRSAYEPEIAADAAGGLVVAWTQEEGLAKTVQSVWRPPAGGWSAQTRLSPAGQASMRPHLAVDAAGDAVAIWERYREGSTTAVEAVSGSTSGNWSAPTDLAAGQNAALAQVAMTAGGDAVAVWTRVLDYENLIEAIARPAGGAWSQPTPVPPPAGQSFSFAPQVAMDAAGDAVAVWSHIGNSARSIQAAVYDVVGPRLDRLAIAGSGEVGAPLSFSVSTYDVWSAVEPPGWSFGDGSAVSGYAVEHTYAEPGEYGVTVTATDAAGNATVATGTVVVSGGDAPPPAPGVPAPEASSPPAEPLEPAPAPGVELLYTPNHPHRPDPVGGPRYTFHFSDQSPAATFECGLDGSRLRPCRSPTVLRHLSRGPHVLRVRSHTPAGQSSATRIVHFFAGRRHQRTASATRTVSAPAAR